MNDYFAFPMHFDDLEKEHHHLHSIQPVDLDIHDRDIINYLKNIDSDVFKRFSEIMSHKNFDYLYLLTKSFSQEVDPQRMKVLEKLSETLHHAGTIICKECLRLNQDESPESLRDSFKMVIFLVLFYLFTIGKIRPKATKLDLLEEATSKNRKKKHKREFQLSQPVLENSKMLIELLKNTLDIDFERLWEKREVDEQLFRKYTDICVRLLESTFAKDDEVLASVFVILEAILKVKPQLCANIQTVLMNLVYESQMIEILVEFFCRSEGLQLQKLCQQTVNCMVVHLMQKSRVNEEGQSIKNTRQFLSKLSVRVPRMFKNFLGYYMKLYDHQSYHLRNAASDILFSTLKLMKEEGEDKFEKSTNDCIVLLVQRTHDQSALCRSYVFGILSQLSMQKLVPQKYMIIFLKAAVNRLNDCSIKVRRKAIQLIGAIIDGVWPVGVELRKQEVISSELAVLELNMQKAAEDEERIKEEMANESHELRIEELGEERNLIRNAMQEIRAKQEVLQEEKETVVEIEKIFRKMEALLGQKTETDILEIIKLFAKLHKRDPERCKEGLSLIILLIFSYEKKVKDEVIGTFIQMHLSRPPNEVASELVKLFEEADEQSLPCFEEILEMIFVRSHEENIVIIPPTVFAYLWNQFIDYEKSQTNVESKRAIVTIMRLWLSRDLLMIKEEYIESFSNILKKYITTKKPDFHILKEIIKIALLNNPIIERCADSLIVATTLVLLGSLDVDDNKWYAASKQLLAYIYQVDEKPQKKAYAFVCKLYDKLKLGYSSSASCHFLFTLSENCLQRLIYLDDMQSKIRSNHLGKNEDPEEEIDMVLGGREAEIEKKIQKIQNRIEDIIKDPLVKRWMGVVEQISTKIELGDELDVIAILSYCKFMSISQEYCKRQMPNLTKILLNSKTSSTIKNNIILSFGDLLFRFPNVVEPYNLQLYQCLKDEDPRVRSAALNIISHLGKGDVIKMKNNLCEIGVLFKDEEPRIRASVKQFFHEVNKKDPKALFNVIPEALVRLSDLESENFEGQKIFMTFFENVSPLMEKEKYSESLIGKLCERLSASSNVLELKNTAYCLAEININEKAVRRVIQSFHTFQKTLEIPEVMNSFKSLVTKVKKSHKTQIKKLGEELEDKVMNSGEEVFNAEEVRKRNERNLIKSKKRPNQRTIRSKKVESTSKKKLGSKRKVSKEYGDDDEEENESFQLEIQSSSRKFERRKANPKRPMIIEESDEDEEYNDQQ